MIELRIECFHRVLPSEVRASQWPYFARGSAMTVEEFDDRLASLARHYELVDEVQAAKLLDGEASSTRACWITFDDGYADVLHHAAAVVAKYGVRPSIFMTTRALSGEWWPPVDRWYSVLRQAKSQLVRLSHNGTHECWELGTESGRERAVVGKLKSAYLNATPARQAEMLEMLADTLDVSHPLAHVPAFLTSSDLVELSSMGWYVGPHGHQHRLLPLLAPDQLEAEVLHSVDTLERLPLQNRSSWFTYSDGRHDQRVRRQVSGLLSSRGYRGALTIEGRAASGEGNLWSTPRFIA
jgi:peptidoglycan/xylan/chitin deacetylase (PgdA/CDA1 family)